MIIGISRALGETAPLITIGALTFIAFLPTSPVTAEFPFISFSWLFDGFTVLPIQAFNWISRPGSDFHANAAAAGLVLLALTLTPQRDRHRPPLSAAQKTAVVIGRALATGKNSMNQQPNIKVSPREGAVAGRRAPSRTKIVARNVNVFYGEKQALFDVSVDIPDRAVTAFIGPSGCGKSTFLRCINRMNDTIPTARVTGTIEIDGEDIYDRRRLMSCSCGPASAWCSRSLIRSPKSIYENVAYGPRIHGLGRSKAELDEIVEESLRQGRRCGRRSKDRLEQPGTGLSGGQQQRLCIARAIAVDPEIILMDEPASALDPIATARIEELIDELRQNYTIVIVTHSMQQAARVSQRTAFFHLGKLVEGGTTEQIFTNPKDKRTQDYITGRFG